MSTHWCWAACADTTATELVVLGERAFRACEEASLGLWRSIQ